MAVITTYVCDVSGKTGNKEDFAEVRIISDKLVGAWQSKQDVTKVVHLEVARKLNLIKLNDVEQQANPEPTLESKLAALLKEYVTEIAYEAGGEAGSEAASNYNRG